MRGGAAAIALTAGSPLLRLMQAPMRPGVLLWIGLRPGRRVPVVSVAHAGLSPGVGVLGDRWAGRPDGGRQVSLIGAENLAAIASFLGRDSVDPCDMRRNLVVSGVNLLALKGGRLRIGTAELEVAGECHPCSRMEEVFGPGGYNAVRGHGGIVARVVQAGSIATGDPVIPIPGGAP